MRTIRGAAVLVVVAVLAAIGFVVFAKNGNDSDSSAKDSGNGKQSSPDGKNGDDKTKHPVKLIGDGSTSDTGPQPNQPELEDLKPGQKPPQFVVFSWDGAAEDGNKLVSEFLKLSEENNAKMTYFLSGIYTLPKDKRSLYAPPKHPVGASDIAFMSNETIRNTIIQMREVWLKGNEVGTHFNGHFCGKNGGGSFSVADWKSETEQAVKFVQNWKTNTGFADLEALPFDYSPGKELIGGRAPCLEGQENLMRAGKELGFRYDASSPGGLQVWPKKGKETGIWNFPLQSLPWPGSPTKSQLSMDYNVMYEQQAVHGEYDPSKKEAWEKEAHDFYMNGFNRAYTTNRAPLFIGNHFEDWNDGIYMNAVKDTVKSVCTKQDVKCVSFRQLTDWLERQDPQAIAKLQGLGVGAQPDWTTFLPESMRAPAQPAAAHPAPADTQAAIERRED